MAWECKYCLKEFKRESAFMNHRCTEMIKNESLKSTSGQAAYKFYADWMKAYDRKVPDIETFAQSRYFNSFIKFAEFVKKLQIPSPERFIEIMKRKDISPILWTRDECYAMYLEWNDRRSDPLEQAQTTIETLYSISEIYEVPISKVFEVIQPGDIIQLLRQRKISPWLLLCSVKFKEALVRMSDDNRNQLQNIIGYGYWNSKFESNSDVVKQMVKFASEMGI
jgi:hypothetical protein